MDAINLISTHKNRIVQIVILLVALSFANKLYHSQLNAKNELSEKKEVEIKKNKTLGEIKQLEIELNDLESAINQKDVSVTLDTLGSLAKSCSVKILSVKPQVPADFSVYTLFPFDISISTNSFHNLAKFISKLEANPDIYFVDSLFMRSSPLGEDHSVTEIRAELKLSTILIKD